MTIITRFTTTTGSYLARCQQLKSTPRSYYSVLYHNDIRELDYASEDFQFIPGGPLNTYYFQRSLPRLPIPKLELTIQRYLAAQKPLLDTESYLRLEKIASNFENDVGMKLHDELLQQDKNLPETSYISGPWFEMYLKDRQPLPINYNPCMVFVEDEVIDKLPKDQRQLTRATNLVISSLRFMRSLESEILEPEVFHLNPKKSDTATYRRIVKLLPSAYATYGSYLFKAFPLDMSQYKSLFRATRIPCVGIDKLERNYPNVKHIVVGRKGNFYKVPVIGSNGNILSINQIKGSLRNILNRHESQAKNPVGILTTENRDTWAKLRENLIKSPVNKDSIEDIDSSLFVLFLDDEELGSEPYFVTSHFMHSDGTNRWFDKPISLIVTKDGWAGINFEHAWGDGVAVMRFFNDINKDARENQWSNKIQARSGDYRPLRFEFDDTSKNGILTAQQNFNKTINNLVLSPFITENFGRKSCKKWGISPDSVMQLGFQIAYHRLFSKFVATYESSSTSAFKYGRTETIRPATDFTKEISQMMSKGSWRDNIGQLQELMKKCSEYHGELAKNAAMGQGSDRHLFAMKYIANQQGLEMPEIFSDQTYINYNYNVLSTSTLSSPAVRVGSFGPVVKDGYGIAYQIWDTGLGCLTSTYKDQTDGKAFADMCSEVFSDIQTVMDS